MAGMRRRRAWRRAVMQPRDRSLRPALEPRERSERVCLGRRVVVCTGRIGRRRERLRADFVAWNERQREQQLVFGKFVQVERPAAREHVVFALGVERGGLLLAGDEVKPAVDVQRHRQRRQAALAREFDLRVQHQVQPRVRRLPGTPALLAVDRPADDILYCRAKRLVARRDEARHGGERPVAFEVAAVGGETLDVEAAGVVAVRSHRPSVVARRGDNAQMRKRPGLILASTSRYRRELLERLRLPFAVHAPGVDETVRDGESPAEVARRLALEKARAVALLNPDAVVIGSDQVAELDGRAIGKPGTHDKARAQLHAMSGRSVVFHTAVAVVCVARGYEAQALVPVTVRVRTLTGAEIEHYLRIEQPYDCAGSAKAETLGIALLDAIVSDDPTALVGLPLIRTCEMLRAAGIDPLAP